MGKYVYQGSSVFVRGEERASALERLFSLDGLKIIPGLIDVHVHLREPGFSYKETIRTGSLAAAHGGFTAVCAMPNLKPTPDDYESLKEELEIIERDAAVRVFPYGTISRGERGEELSSLSETAPYVCAFSDDGHGVQDEGLMREAMLEAKKLGKIIAAHCEVNELLNGGYIHEGKYAREHGHRGISSESEWREIERDIRLSKETGCAYHVCHISTKESVELIRKAKKEGVDISCETAPHYLILCDEDLMEDGRFKMNPPLRGKEDRQALIEGLLDGTIDMIITDHAPHSLEEKSRGLEHSLMGIVGLETSFPLMYTHFVRTGILSLERLVELMRENPLRRFGLPDGKREGMLTAFTVFDLNSSYMIDPEDFLSMGRVTPFSGCEVYGRCLLTVSDGKIAYMDGSI